jgi:hypothetical protein
VGTLRSLKTSNEPVLNFFKHRVRASHKVAKFRKSVMESAASYLWSQSGLDVELAIFRYDPSEGFQRIDAPTGFYGFLLELKVSNWSGRVEDILDGITGEERFTLSIPTEACPQHPFKKGPVIGTRQFVRGNQLDILEETGLIALFERFPDGWEKHYSSKELP